MTGFTSSSIAVSSAAACCAARFASDKFRRTTTKATSWWCSGGVTFSWLWLTATIVRLDRPTKLSVLITVTIRDACWTAVATSINLGYSTPRLIGHFPVFPACRSRSWTWSRWWYRCDRSTCRGWSPTRITSGGTSWDR